ncbi:hypothetical protein JTB14_003300 [Gonioctena quinquepunctata]|nr:hypothetical protein JTB14_003300 [Gonioctena quinquepunctata]
MIWAIQRNIHSRSHSVASNKVEKAKMKWLVFFTLMIIGLCHAEFPSEGEKGHKVLRRVARQAIRSVGGQLLVQTEKTIISNCRANGHPEARSDLEESYSKLKQCVGKKQMFLITKEEFIANLEECSRDAIRKTENCLADDQKHFPQFILDFAKSVVSFMYDDFQIIDLICQSCACSLQGADATRKYIKCLTDTSQATHDTEKIPSLKKSFCDKVLPESRCFTEMIKDNCDDTANFRKFREDLMNSIEVPCGTKKSA